MAGTAACGAPPKGHEAGQGCTEMAEAAACGTPWGLRWRCLAYVELPMGPRNAVLGVADACGHPLWGLTWSSPWGRAT
eukprot:1724662-Pyramimonas_sp.AAC.1